jgi:hypothetical protein
MQTPEERKKYNREYYLKNKKKISTRKRVRYSTDSDYREKIKDNAMTRFREKLQKKPMEKLGVFLKNPDSPRGTKIARIDGELIVLRTITELAKSVGFTTAAIRNWHNSEIIPKPTFIDYTNKKWYNNVYVLNLRKAITMRKGKSVDEFQEIVENCFNGKI